ncbi:MAG: hypothetical protein FJ386_03540 [Verrucomicrobia bacterium]|nr:hypothetical protein [Verrucomicrobiota bacterium]
MNTPLRRAARAGAFALAVLAFGGTLRAQTVTTIGGGPKSFPITIGNSAGSADGNTFLKAQFNTPSGLALDSAGNLYIADLANNSVRKLSSAGSSSGFTTTLIANLSSPIAVAVDSTDALYVLTQGDGTLRKYTTAGVLVSTLTTTLTAPTAMSLDSSTNLVVTELGGAVKRVLQTGTVTNLAAAGTFVSPRGVAVLATNSIAIVSGNAVVNLNPVANTTNIIAGNTTAGMVDGLAADARFNTPQQITRGPDGSILVADRLNHRVRVIKPEGTVSTLYGVSTNLWVDEPLANPILLAGWVDGAVPAAARDPLAVAIHAGGTNLFTAEAGWHLIRMVSGVNFAPGATGGTGSGGSGGAINSNLTANLITFGFQNGEGSTEFIGAPGQTFFAPVTITLLPGQEMYSLGFSIAVTNDPGAPAVTNGALSFDSMLQRPVPSNPAFFEPIPPSFAFSFITNLFTNTTDFTVTTNIIPTFTNSVFIDTNFNVMSVAWLETKGRTNLYNSLAQDLITFSQAHINQFNKSGGSVFAGGFGFQIPANAPTGTTYRIQVFNATAATNVAGGVTLTAPTNGSLTVGPINAIKQVTVNVRPYLVGDVSSFRWFNAGDFGDGTLTLDDASQTFNSAIYLVNIPPLGSDFFDAMDSSNGTTNGLLNASSGSIDAVAMGDGVIAVDDVFVTLRRSLNPFATWYVRFWTNGVRTNAVTTNSLPKPTFGFQRPAIELASHQAGHGAEDSHVLFTAGDGVRAGQTVTVPVTASLFGPYPLRVLMLRLRVQPLDSSPAITQPVQFNFLQAGRLGNPFQSANPSPDAWVGIWLNDHAPGLIAGDSLLGNLVVTLPPGTPASASYLIRFDHASASPNGIALFAARAVSGLITATDRSASSFGDTLPDQWKLRWFGTLYDVRANPTLDLTGDGMPNWAKLRAGIDPLDPSQSLRLAPRVTTDALGRPNGVTLRWPTVRNKRYVLEGSPGLGANNWSVLSTNVTGNGGDARLTNSASGLQFFRLRLVEP